MKPIHLRPRQNLSLLALCFAFFAAAPASSGADEIVILELHGPIDRFQAVYVQRALAQAQRDQARLVVLEIDTFGGRVDSALRIANALGNSPVPTAAWVANTSTGTGVSWSAGALIAFATRQIFMAPGTSIGAAAPVVQAPGGAAAPADEKTLSAIRAQMAALAERNGHSMVIARAMVDASLEAHLVEVDGSPRIVDAEGLRLLEQRTASGEIELRVEKKIIGPGSLLTLTAGEMESLGVSAGSPQSVQELADLLDLENSSFRLVRPDTPDRIVALLTGGGFTTLLILTGLIALFLEITNPGFGLPGTVAVAAFATFFAANMLLGRVGSVEIILFVTGLLLLVVEIFILPGFGVAGVTGLASITLSLIFGLQEFILPEEAWQWDVATGNILVVLGSLGAALAIMVGLAFFLPRRSFFSRLALATTQNASEGYSVQPREVHDHLLHKEGTVRTDLRPVGSVLLEEGEIITAESQGEFVERGSIVEVIRVDGNRVVVRRKG
ncbi:membrane-bound serine protease (ClpP class) [Alkalispirochaeta americana]|uniref:Membrane-bound serine protease (ClpP class) n=1 Tax=Alkalispirochaeta americana TaxID=159291 RepID=A0A1N6UN92_9SPIO|nr:NfeD family protein [Alkalispirochaeta americana]SIQ66766.1 membrane-bound serine protease (ClpP class) [Alkalispirochaeta americana]